jgi:hypothetical protein
VGGLVLFAILIILGLRYLVRNNRQAPVPAPAMVGPALRLAPDPDPEMGPAPPVMGEPPTPSTLNSPLAPNGRIVKLGYPARDNAYG